MIKQLVAIAGPVASGKDTLADALVKYLNFKKLSFAYSLKHMLYTLPFLEEHRWDDRLWKEEVEPFYGKSPREMAQTLGTQWGRDLVHPDVWVKVAEYEMERSFATSLHDKFVFPDLRFPNEAKWIRHNHGLIIHISRRGSGIKTTHSSEAGIPYEEEDMQIYNEGTITELEHMIWMITARAKVLKLPRE